MVSGAHLLNQDASADKRTSPDARKLAELLRAGLLRPVYHGHEATRKLKELVRGYETLSLDTQRVMGFGSRRFIYRGHGIRTSGHSVYQLNQREPWLQLLTALGARQRVAWLYEALDLWLGPDR